MTQDNMAFLNYRRITRFDFIAISVSSSIKPFFSKKPIVLQPIIFAHFTARIIFLLDPLVDKTKTISSFLASAEI